MSKSTTNVVLGLVAGASIGAVTGLLFAPDKGYKTRKKISKQMRKSSKEMSDTISEKMDETKEKLNDLASDLRNRASEAEEILKDKVNHKMKA